MQHLIRSIAIAGLALVVGGAVLAQQPSRDAAAKPSVGTATISGTVVTDERTPRPVRRATVTLSGAGASMQQLIVTDDAGRFAFARLPAATYTSVRASKLGYVPSVYGEKRVGGMGIPVTITDGQRLTLSLKMLRGAVISGTLLDQFGRPSAQTSVQATLVKVVNGERTAAPNYIGLTSTSTDDRGNYRIYGLAPGDYVVAATPRLSASGDLRPITEEELRWGQQQIQPSTAGAATIGASAPPPRPAQSVAYTPIYFPGTFDGASAALVTVAAGQERSGVDFATQFVVTARVEGTVVDPAGQPPATAQINLVPRDDTTMLMSDPFFALDAIMFGRPTVVNGKFSMAGVRPGAYTVSVRAAPAQAGARGGRGAASGPMTLWATTDITVNGEDVSGISLRLEPGMTVAGRVVFDATTLPVPTDTSRVSIRLTAPPNPSGSTVTVTVGASSAQLGPDGTFKLEGVTPGRYLLSAYAPGGTPSAAWLVRSAMVNGIDAADVPFEVRPNQDISNAIVTFTDRGAEISGTILDAAGKPTPEFSIMLVPADKTQWSQRSRRLRPPVRAGTDGKFKFANLLPGEYYLAALTDFDPNDYDKPDFLEQLVATGIKVTLAEGEKKGQDVKIAGG